MKKAQIREIMQQIAPRFEEEAEARSAAADFPHRRRKLMLRSGALLCAVLIGTGALLYYRGSGLSTGSTAPDVIDISAEAENAYYNQAMKDYFSMQNGTPCTYDFTGCGQDLDIDFDSEDPMLGTAHHIHISAIAGDAYRLFCFFEYTDEKDAGDRSQLMQNSERFMLRALQKGSNEKEASGTFVNLTVMREEETNQKILRYCCLEYVCDMGYSFAGKRLTLTANFTPAHMSYVAPGGVSKAFEPAFLSVPEPAAAEDEILCKSPVSDKQFRFRYAAVGRFGLTLFSNSPEESDPEMWLAEMESGYPETYLTSYPAIASAWTAEAYGADGSCKQIALSGIGNINALHLNQDSDDTQDTCVHLSFAEPLDLRRTVYLSINGVRVPLQPAAESAVYNPDRNEYYDSNMQEWDEAAHEYRPVTAPVQGYNPPEQYEERPFTGTIPEEFDSALKAYDEADAKAVQNGPPNVSSAFHVGFALPEYQHLQELTVPYIDCVISLASTDQAYRVLAQCLLEPLTQYTPSNSCGAEYEMRMQTAYQEASDAVNALGESITAEDAAGLQQTYGYMIAPALQDMGRLDLLQIDPESPCRNPEQLAEFAKCFA